MTRERIIRVIAGTMILLSLILGLAASKWWFLLTAFVGVNLLQAGITNWCLMDDILRKIFRIKNEAEKAAERK